MKDEPDAEAQATGAFHPGDVGAALMLLTRLPVASRLAADRGARSAWAWPLAGAVVAVLSWASGAALMAAGLPPVLAAGATLAVIVLVTGALHEDGLADCADGFWGGFTPERRLAILRDSRIGSYGVVALVLTLGMRWAAMATLFAAGNALAGLLAAGMLSRASMTGVMAILPFARPDGLAVHAGRPSSVATATAVAIAVTTSILALGPSALAAALAAGAAAACTAGVARAKIGGQTGDVLGAAQQVSEIAVLLTCVALAAQQAPVR